MATIELKQETFESEIDKGGIVLIDWWAPWCGPCKAFAPIYEAAAAHHSDVRFAKIDTDEEQELAGEFGIRSIPTLMAFRDGILVFAQPGMLGAPVLEELIGKIKALDMAQVRKELEEQEKNAPSDEDWNDEDEPAS